MRSSCSRSANFWDPAVTSPSNISRCRVASVASRSRSLTRRATSLIMSAVIPYMRGVKSARMNSVLLSPSSSRKNGNITTMNAPTAARTAYLRPSSRAIQTKGNRIIALKGEYAPPVPVRRKPTATNERIGTERVQNGAILRHGTNTAKRVAAPSIAMLRVTHRSLVAVYIPVQMNTRASANAPRVGTCACRGRLDAGESLAKNLSSVMRNSPDGSGPARRLLQLI